MNTNILQPEQDETRAISNSDSLGKDVNEAGDTDSHVLQRTGETDSNEEELVEETVNDNLTIKGLQKNIVDALTESDSENSDEEDNDTNNNTNNEPNNNTNNEPNNEPNKRDSPNELEYKVFKETNLNDTCRITMRKFRDNEIVTCLPCNHVFDPTAIEKWVFTQQANCPICRYQLKNTAEIDDCDIDDYNIEDYDIEDYNIEDYEIYHNMVFPKFVMNNLSNLENIRNFIISRQ